MPHFGEHSLELWVITADGPVSLGVLPTGGNNVLSLPAAVASGITRNLASGGMLTLAVSLEPAGGSPTGKPTGAVLTSGTAIRPA